MFFYEREYINILASASTNAYSYFLLHHNHLEPMQIRTQSMHTIASRPSCLNKDKSDTHVH